MAVFREMPVLSGSITHCRSIRNGAGAQSNACMLLSACCMLHAQPEAPNVIPSHSTQKLSLLV